MRNEIEELRARQQKNERLLAALVANEKSEEVLERLRTGETIEAVLERLDVGGNNSDKWKGKAIEIMQGRSSRVTTEANITTYPQFGTNQAINGALRGARSIGHWPRSMPAFVDNQGDFTIHNAAWDALQSGHEVGSSSRLVNLNAHGDALGWPAKAHSMDRSPLIGTWHQGSKDVMDFTTENQRDEGQTNILGDGFAAGKRLEPIKEIWTDVTNDERLVEHLMALYFCWEYPTFASLSKEHFLDDFRSGNPKHCSSLLVNTVLAIGCRFSSQPATRTVAFDSMTSGDHFFAEAKRLLAQQQDKHILTTVQALGLMSIREASIGRTSEATFYSGQSIRLAIEMGLHLEHQSGGGELETYEHAVRSATFWGAFSLDQCWCLTIGQLPVFSRDTKLITTPSMVDNSEASPWIPYTDDGAPLERNCTQPSNVRSVYKTFAELSELVHRALYTCYSPNTVLNGQALVSIYTQFLAWYDAIPEVLRLGHNFTPSVLFTHMYYHYAILLLFRPLIKLDILSSGIRPRDVCYQAADAISTLVFSYDQLYTLRRTPSFVPYFVLTSSITHLVGYGSHLRGPEALLQCMSDLHAMDECHGFAKRSRQILQYLALEWDIAVTWNEDQEIAGDVKALCRPKKGGLNKFCVNVEPSDIKSTFRIDGNSISTYDDDGNEILNDTLFSPFPLQGRPLLGPMKKSGFKLTGSDI
ncbi:fungal-specific transcription factor domain-containing protein [Bisporella sp. PMI_857]|nr:fungal-specific transcription factor domain-containing protein [Bisporella sp. PMI_857]